MPVRFARDWFGGLSAPGRPACAGRPPLPGL